MCHPCSVAMLFIVFRFPLLICSVKAGKGGSQDGMTCDSLNRTKIYE